MSLAKDICVFTFFNVVLCVILIPKDREKNLLAPPQILRQAHHDTSFVIFLRSTGF